MLDGKKYLAFVRVQRYKCTLFSGNQKRERKREAKRERERERKRKDLKQKRRSGSNEKVIGGSEEDRGEGGESELDFNTRKHQT